MIVQAAEPDIRPSRPQRMTRWPWLFCLPLFFASWPAAHLTPPTAIAGGVGVFLFLGLYFAAPAAGGRGLLPISAAILLLSFGLAFTAGVWTVISIYAAALAGETRPFGRAAAAVVVMAGLTAVWALSIGQPLAYWGYGVFLMVVAGFGAASRIRLEDQNRALAEARSELRRMAAVAERERIGRDLHDLLGRTLTLVALKADLAARLARRDADAAEREMQEVAAEARSALTQVRAAVQGMRGASLAHELQASRAALAAAGVVCELRGDAGLAPAPVGAVLAMALREAVTNVIRHAGARRCDIAIESNSGQVRLYVSDDGCGSGTIEGGGIAGMRDRLRAAGGGLTVEGGPSGTRVIAVLPTGATL